MSGVRSKLIMIGGGGSIKAKMVFKKWFMLNFQKNWEGGFKPPPHFNAYYCDMTDQMNKFIILCVTLIFFLPEFNDISLCRWKFAEFTTSKSSSKMSNERDILEAEIQGNVQQYSRYLLSLSPYKLSECICWILSQSTNHSTRYWVLIRPFFFSMINYTKITKCKQCF